MRPGCPRVAGHDEDVDMTNSLGRSARHVSETTGHVAMQSLMDLSVIRDSPLFAGLDGNTLLGMLPRMWHERWPRGYALASSSRTDRRFHILLQGRIKVARQHPDNGRELVLFLLGPGDCFNVFALGEGEGPDLQVRALEDVEILSASMNTWNEWLEHNPLMGIAVNRIVADQIEHLTDLAGELALDDTMTRLVRLLLRHFDTEISTQNLIRDLHQEELAHMIGTVRPVVARLLAQLRHEGIVDIKKGTLQVHDVNKLRHKLDPRRQP